jgi:hypothetical protein
MVAVDIEADVAPVLALMSSLDHFRFMEGEVWPFGGASCPKSERIQEIVEHLISLDLRRAAEGF